MRKVAKAVLAGSSFSIIMGGAVYLCFVFANLKWNPALWSFDTRTFLAIMWFIVFVVSLFFAVGETDN